MAIEFFIGRGSSPSLSPLEKPPVTRSLSLLGNSSRNTPVVWTDLVRNNQLDIHITFQSYCILIFVNVQNPKQQRFKFGLAKVLKVVKYYPLLCYYNALLH